MKKIVSALALLLTLVLLSSCISITVVGGEEKKTEPAGTAESAATAGTAAETKPAEVVRPSAAGQEVAAYDLSFYLPKDMTANPYNGMLGVYEFYTGEYDSRPTGMDITLSVLAESNTKGDAEGYAKEKAPTGAAMEKKSFNGTEWMVFTIGTVTYYCTTFHDGLYEITASQGSESAETFRAAVQMMESTLFLAVEDD